MIADQAQLEAVQRAFAKAKQAEGPHALADWATQNAPALLAFVAAKFELDQCFQSDIDALRPLYPGLTAGVSLVLTAADDIRAMRADRAKRAGTAEAPPEGQSGPEVDVHQLYATPDGAFWSSEFCRVVRQTNGATLDEGFVTGWFANAIELGRRVQERIRLAPLVDALRPFAAFGSPILLERMEVIAERLSAPDPDRFFAVTDDDDVVMAKITRADCERAHELVNEADGGGGA